jgi:hypothetical protein
MLNGYDIDGVLTAGVRPVEPYIIISGRNKEQFQDTTDMLWNLGITGPVYLRPFGGEGQRELSGMWKAWMISTAKVTTFYEDEDLQADIIRHACPDCKVVMVRNGIPEQ